ncbi:MAG: hypothetical protein ACPLQP_09505, partial [Moorellaceae bacterium]
MCYPGDITWPEALLWHCSKVTIEYILEKAPEKFVIEGEAVFSKKLFLEQLVYTEDVRDKEATLATVLGAKLSSPEIEQYLSRQAGEP